MGRRRGQERLRERELEALHTDSFAGRMLGQPRAYGSGRGRRQSLWRSSLAYLAAIALVVVPLLLVDLWGRWFGG